ncbi:TGS domain-containing protein [Escherichia coli]
MYVFTPKGDVVDLPAGSTPLDFAYHIHSDMRTPALRGQKIAGALLPFHLTSCRWATGLKLSPRNSRTPAVTG